MIEFTKYGGDLIGLPTDDNHLVYIAGVPVGKVLFSVARQGDAVTCHFASDKKGLRHLKPAINSFCEFCFKMYDWCKMVLAKVGKASIVRLIEKCGFTTINFGRESNKFLCVKRRTV